MIVREQTEIVPYDGRTLSSSAELTIHSYAGDVTYDVDEFTVEVSPYTLRITFPYTQGSDGLQYCGIYHQIINYANTVQEVVPFNNPITDPNIEFTHDN